MRAILSSQISYLSDLGLLKFFFGWRHHEEVFVAWPWRELKASGTVTRVGNQASERLRIGNGKE